MARGHRANGTPKQAKAAAWAFKNESKWRCCKDRKNKLSPGEQLSLANGLKKAKIYSKRTHSFDMNLTKIVELVDGLKVAKVR